ncbi:alpha/beta hydrolase family protein [Hymenobacter cheonanensis]|uniref:alpha/beta hydrolase family protein n=1 Tax=Hymenobacter sp. CA2-7 TaxID=3063993 RepID=UPI00271231E3|nr:alpha/beta hydrolase [Hymenobacter sp. CA2-7]MDO7885245.1 alpha/beta hydrolase [Hymenobacter sp. CA2-7]
MESSKWAWILVWALGLSNGAWAQNAGLGPPAQASRSLEGVWQGALPVPGGALDLRFSLVALVSGEYFAALDVPMQKLSRVPATVRQPAGTDSVLLLVPQVSSRFLARRSADGQLLTGIWCRPGLRTPLQLRYLPLPAAPATSPGTRFAPPYRAEEVAFQNFPARLRLAGTLTVPPGAGPFPAVVLVSDLGEQDRDGLAPGGAQAASPVSYRLLGSLADYLTRHGVAVLRFDDRGVGQSGGINAAATPTQRAGDVQAALNFLRTRPEADLLRLGLVGHGEGANVALLVAAQPLAPAFVVGLGAYGLPGYETLLQQHELAWQTQKLPPAQLATRLRRERTLYDLIRYSTSPAQTQAMVANLLRQGEATLSAADAQQQAAALLTPWSRAFLAFDPLEGLAAVQCPVLLISGLADEQAPPAQHLAALERELRAGGNRLVTAFRPAGVNHLLQPPNLQWTMLNGELKPIVAPVVQEELRQWLATQLGK